MNLSVSAAEEPWSFDSQTKTLYINDQEVVKFQAYKASDVNTPWHEYQLDIEKVVIKDGITQLGRNCFTNCLNLKTVILPETVTDLDQCVFENCVSLEHIDLSHIKSMQYCCFAFCESLKSITIPDDCYIEWWSFTGCKNLTVNLEGNLKHSYVMKYIDFTTVNTLDIWQITSKTDSSDTHFVMYKSCNNNTIFNNYDCVKIATLNAEHDELPDYRNVSIGYWTSFIGCKRVVLRETAKVKYARAYNQSSESTSNFFIYENLQTYNPTCITTTYGITLGGYIFRKGDLL